MRDQLEGDTWISTYTLERQHKRRLESNKLDDVFIQGLTNVFNNKKCKYRCIMVLMAVFCDWNVSQQLNFRL